MEVSGGFTVSDVFPSLTWLHVLSGMRPKIEKMHHKVDKMLESIIDVHKVSRERAKKTKDEAEEEDLVDVLLKLQQREDFDFSVTNENVKAVILDIFTAGGETSSITVEWAMSEMLKNPRVLEKAQAEVRQIFRKKGKVDEKGMDELNFLKLVIKEVLRLHPPAPLLLPRECQEKCEINGYEIPVKTRVVVNAWAIGRDPKHWTEADSFMPERFVESSIDYKGANFEYIPFGAGRRICPGITFGMANVVLPLANMLYHFDWKLPNGAKGEDLDMTEKFGATVSRKENLYVVPIAHRHCPLEKA
ncbi:Cytochrome P450 [Dillenia turbinata]|uniref:Cytochrome P450 n=1 Tax=Dillenia turbinata TaxID=194707 RepID=A0AAN8WJ22_9MAGN